MEEELEILKKLHRQSFKEDQLLEMYHQYRDRYRILFHLIQQPQFPERHALNVIPRLYSMDLLRVIKNTRTNPNIRRRAEMEFKIKYPRFPLGEKISYMKIAPDNLLKHFVDENDKRILKIMLSNQNCTEELLLQLINRETNRFTVYEILMETEWYKRPQVALAISHDTQAPIKLLITILPFLHIRQLEKLYLDENTHDIVKRNIIDYIKQRNPESDD